MAEEIGNTLIKDLELGDEMITIQKSKPISEGLELLQSKNIRTLGVTDDHGDCLVGLITAFDIMTYICFGAYQITDINSDIDIKSAMKSLDVPIGNVTGLFHKETNRIWHFNESDPISNTYEAMCLGVHQAAIACEGDKLKLLSQHDLVKFLMKHGDVFNTNKTLEEAELAKPSTVTTIEDEKLALLAFRRMETSGNPALPVVDSSNQVVATISASDVRKISTDNIACVLKPIPDFLVCAHGNLPKAMTCTASSTVADVMKQLTDNYHRHAWVVDGDGKLVTSLSLSDLLDYCLQPRA